MEEMPDPQSFKDGAGLRPRWRLFVHAPRQYLWLRAPRWWMKVVCRWRDRRYRR